MSQEMLYAWAVAYRQAGWCVLPAKEKQPVVKWKMYQDVLPSVEQVQDWFVDAPDDAQIALVTGKVSGVSVLDVDCHKEGCAGKRGGLCQCDPESVHLLRAQFPITLTSVSGSGGYHLFYKYEPKLMNSVGLANPQIDIRTDGGIIILPPSLHNRVHKEYEWDELVPWGYEAPKGLGTIPASFLDNLRMKPKTDWVKLLTGNGIGKRNVSATALIGKILRQFQPDEFHAVWQLIWSWNKDHNNPPLSDRELGTTFESIAKKELAGRGRYGK
jgi:hypothetical protein